MCAFCPGEIRKRFWKPSGGVVNDPNVTVEPLSPEFRVANYSPTDTALYNAIRQVSAQYFPGTPVVPRLTSGYTENQRYRPLGIDSYGFNPYTATDEEGNTEHGNDERIRVEEVRRGFRVLYDVVTAVAGKRSRSHGFSLGSSVRVYSAVLLVLLVDVVVGHAGDVVADHARQRTPALAFSW